MCIIGLCDVSTIRSKTRYNHTQGWQRGNSSHGRHLTNKYRQSSSYIFSNTSSSNFIPTQSNAHFHTDLPHSNPTTMAEKVKDGLERVTHPFEDHDVHKAKYYVRLREEGLITKVYPELFDALKYEIKVPEGKPKNVSKLEGLLSP